MKLPGWPRKAANTIIYAYRNRKIFRNVISLDDCDLGYRSVLLGRMISEQEVAQHIAAGDVIIVESLVQKLGLKDRLDRFCRSHFATGFEHLENIHNSQSVEQILDSAFHARSDEECLAIQTSIMSRLLKPHSNNYYVELQPNLRLHLPYKSIRDEEALIEKIIGRGKLNPHGQHKDSWRYHPENTINVWIALTAATPRNGMAILPESLDYQPRFSVHEQEIEERVRTYPSQQWVTDLSPGDAVLFRAELLHGSIINTSTQTRFAFSMRCSLEEPAFHRDHQYNYVGYRSGRWHSLVFNKLFRAHDFQPLSRDESFAAAESRGAGLSPEYYDEECIQLRINGELKTFPRRCPHAGRDLLFGELDADGSILCPAHRMRIRERVSRQNAANTD